MLDVAMLVLLEQDSAMAMEILAILVLGIWEQEDTMARGMLRLIPNTWLPPMLVLVIPMLVMVLAIPVIPILPPMDMETLVMLDVAMP